VSVEEQTLGRAIFDHASEMDTGTEITVNLFQAMAHIFAYLSGAIIESECIGATFAFPAKTTGLHIFTHI
jgi:hypothetical protein